MAAGGPHLADTGKKLLEEPVFTTHSPAAVAGGSRQSLPPTAPRVSAGLQQDTVSKSTGSRPALVLEKPRAQKRKKGLIHPLMVATEGRSHRESPKPRKLFLRLKTREILSSKIKASTQAVWDDKTSCPNCCRSGAGWLLKGLRMLSGTTGTGAMLSPRLAAGYYSSGRKQRLGSSPYTT